MSVDFFRDVYEKYGLSHPNIVYPCCTPMIIIMISIQWYIYTTYSNTKHRRKQIHRRDSVVQVWTVFNFWFWFFDTRRETQFLKVFHNHIMLTTPLMFGTSCGPISISQHHSRTQLLNIMVGSARGVMVIIVRNGHDNTSSNSGWDWLHFT